jgi:hypothetical protein
MRGNNVVNMASDVTILGAWQDVVHRRANISGVQSPADRIGTVNEIYPRYDDANNTSFCAVRSS